jgi:hypothetical protein
MHAQVSRTWCHSVAPSSLRSDVISAFLLDTILVAFFAVFIVPQRGYAGSRLPGQVTFRVGVSDQEVTESVDTLFPLYAPKDSLFFFIGSHWFFGVRFNMPFDLANIAEGRSPFAGFWEFFKPKSKEEHLLFASRMTESMIRTSRVTASKSDFIQIATSKKVVASGTTTQDTVAPFSQTSVLTLDGAPITVTQVDIVGTPGASNVTITNSTISKMKAESTAIAPSMNATLDKLRFQNNIKRLCTYHLCGNPLSVRCGG